MQARTQVGLIETIEMSYKDHGRYRSVSTPFHIDGQVHIRLAINGVPYESFRMHEEGEFGWKDHINTAPDEATLLMSLVPYAQFSSEAKQSPTKTIEKYSTIPDADKIPKWMELASDIWGLNQ